MPNSTVTEQAVKELLYSDRTPEQKIAGIQALLGDCHLYIDDKKRQQYLDIKAPEDRSLTLSELLDLIYKHLIDQEPRCKALADRISTFAQTIPSSLSPISTFLEDLVECLNNPDLSSINNLKFGLTLGRYSGTSYNIQQKIRQAKEAGYSEGYEDGYLAREKYKTTSTLDDSRIPDLDI